MTRVSRTSDSSVRWIGILALLAALAGASALAACGSSGATAPGDSPAGAVTVAITGALPKDARTEPPWNGRFVQVTVRTASPAAMAARDWSVFVNGSKQPLARPPDILPYAADAATVAFLFRAPYGDLGTYRFRVVYSPPGGPKAERAWRYDWAP
jgi:hypothetical protein